MSKRRPKWHSVHFLSNTVSTREVYCANRLIVNGEEMRCPTRRGGWPAVLAAPMIPMAVHPADKLGGAFEDLGAVLLNSCRTCGWRTEAISPERLSEARRRILRLLADAKVA